MVLWLCIRSLVGQNVIAPSKFTTDGEFIAVSVEISNVYAIVKRTINGSPRYTLETFDDTFTTDSASTTTNATIDLPHLRGKTVSIVRDGLVDPDQTLQDSPYRVTFISTPTSTRGAEVGLSYSVTVKTMPSEPVLSSGSVQGFKKRIIQVDALVNETQNMTINGQLIAFRSFGEDVLGKAVVPFTGMKTAHGFLGFSQSGQITISQSVPLKMTVLGLEYRLSVGN